MNTNMIFLKFVNRLGHVPHDSLTLGCNSVYKRQVKWDKGKSTAYAELYFPFEEPEEGSVVLIATVSGTPGYRHIAGSNLILFEMNIRGETIDKTVI